MNPATSTQSDRTSVALLKKTISELSSQVTLLTAKRATVQAENARMKNQDSNKPQLDIDIGRPSTRPHWTQTHIKIKTYILEADSGSTQMGTAPPMGTRWSSPTHQLPAGSQIAIITSQLRD